MRITDKQIRQIIREEILRETGEAPTLGPDVKGGSAATAAEKKLQSNPALQTILDKVTSKSDAKSVIQEFLKMLTEKGISKEKLTAALKEILASIGK